MFGRRAFPLVQVVIEVLLYLLYSVRASVMDFTVKQFSIDLGVVKLDALGKAISNTIGFITSPIYGIFIVWSVITVASLIFWILGFFIAKKAKQKFSKEMESVVKDAMQEEQAERYKQMNTF